MNEFSGRFGISSWPTWLKLLGGLLLAMVVPLIVSLVLAISSIEAVSSENMQAFIAKSASHHARGVGEIFSEAQSIMNRYLNDEDARALLMAILSRDDESVSQITKARAIAGLQDGLLNRSNPAFDYVELLDAEGRLVLHAEAGRDISVVGGTDLSQTAAYQRGLEALLSGGSQVLSIDADDEDQPLLDVVNVLTQPDPETGETTAVGYLVGRMITDLTDREVLEFNFDFLNIQSRLVTARGLVIDQTGVHEANAIEINDDVQRRLDMEGAFQEVTTEDGEQIVRYYAQIPGSPFTFISQGTIDSVTNQVFRFFAQRGFALIVGLGALMAILVLLGLSCLCRRCAVSPRQFRRWRGAIMVCLCLILAAGMKLAVWPGASPICAARW